MPASEDDFRAFFYRATACKRYPYQTRLACEPLQSRPISVPSRAGKAAAVILGWVWRLKVDPASAPRRLVYCLPMRVLVEQTKRSGNRVLGEHFTWTN